MNDNELQNQFRIEAAAEWDREAALIDNEKLSGVWLENSWRHREAIIQEMAALPDNDLGSQARQRFAEAYDVVIDFSILPGGTQRA